MEELSGEKIETVKKYQPFCPNVARILMAVRFCRSMWNFWEES